MNIIGDIAGQYDALLRLVKEMPNEEIILVGDLVDRGPESKEVIQWAIDNNIKTCLGNHEHMMIDFYEKTGMYDPGIWHMNGGNMTHIQYKNDPETRKQHLTWLKSLPLYYKFKDLFVSHGPWKSNITLDEATKIDVFGDLMDSLIWNREAPVKMDEFQVFGHNSHWGLTWLDDWGVCLDASRDRVLTGMNWPSKTIYQVPYIKELKNNIVWEEK